MLQQKIKIQNKYVNEAIDRNKNIQNINDKEYLNQIIAKILK